MAKVALHNPGRVDQNAIGMVAELARLPAGRICLIIGDDLLADEYQGCTIPRRSVPWLGNVFGLSNHLQEDWECGVVIGQKWAALQPTFPAYFAYLLGHEFGHAATVLSRLWLAAYEDMLFRYIPRIVTDREWRWNDFPHEVRYDRFGIAIAEASYGRDTVEREFEQIRRDGLTDDAERLLGALNLEPTTDLETLPEELARFSRPHRDALIELWRSDLERGILGIGQDLKRLDYLWTR